MREVIVFLFIILLTNIVSAQESFNLEIDLPETYESVPAGKNIWFTTKLVNFANQQRIDVTLKYEIFDINKQLKTSKTETVAVETQASFVGNLKVPENLEKGVYFLKATLSSPFGESESEISFNVIKEQTKAWITIKFSIFDIKIEIPDDYKIIQPGDELLTSIKLINLGSAGRIDVFLDFWIADSEQNIILKKKDTVAVETQANFVRIFDIPKNVNPGKYNFYAKITYADGKEAVAEHSFNVIKKQIDNRIYYITGIILFILLFLLTLGKLKPFLKKIIVKEKVYEIVKKRER